MTDDLVTRVATVAAAAAVDGMTYAQADAAVDLLVHWPHLGNAAVRLAKDGVTLAHEPAIAGTPGEPVGRVLWTALHRAHPTVPGLRTFLEHMHRP
jgi:hypothetical protein